MVGGKLYVTAAPTTDLTGVRYPDGLVAFGVDPQAYEASNGYVISEQGKPPDLVLEVASRSSGRIDTLEKRRDYAALGIPEYWRFDETGEHHGTRLAGERLVVQQLCIDGMKRLYLDGEQRHPSVVPQFPQSRTLIISKISDY